MKFGPRIRSIFPAAILGAIFVLISAASAQGQILLTVDITNPDAVVFRATVNGPSTSVSSNVFNDGIDLVDFFTANVYTGISFYASPTSLTTGDGSAGPVFDTGASTLSGSEIDDVDLDVFSSTNFSTMSFTTGQPALAGALTFNLSGQPLPVVGTSHELLSGYIGSGSTPIGSYLVVEAPEPSTWTLLALGFITLALARGRRARS